MLDKSSEAYGEKGYKLGNHLFHTPGLALENSPIPIRPIIVC
jgi:hypothetical protein